MTGRYDWNPMPHVVDVRCPSCGKGALFEFAEIVRIKEKSDVGFFEGSKTFEYGFFRDRSGHGWHGAIFYAGLRCTSTESIPELPPGYAPEDWNHSPCLYRAHGLDLGAVVCHRCGLRRKHELSWPDEAFYQIEYRGTVLWAYNRESATALRSFISSIDRDAARYKWCSFLRHVPTGFLFAGARDEVVKRLDRLLMAK